MAVSRGVVDQEFCDSTHRALAHATKIGKRAQLDRIIHHDDGSPRRFVWSYHPIPKARAVAPEAPPAVRRVSRGAVQGLVQGVLL